MTNTEILYSALIKSDITLPKIEIEKTDEQCMICGKTIKAGAPYKKILSGNFTDWDMCKNRNSMHICKECGTVIKTREFRINNFLADKDHLYIFKKKDIEQYLFNLEKYVQGDFVIGITRSFKKHNSFRCTVNTDTDTFYIREEDKEYIFDINITKPLYKLLNEAYLYFSKDELLTGQYNMRSIQEFGLSRFNQYEKTFRQHRGTHYYDLLVYLMNSEKRNEEVQERVKRQKEAKKKKEQLKKEKEKQLKGQVNLFETIREE